MFEGSRSYPRYYRKLKANSLDLTRTNEVHLCPSCQHFLPVRYWQSLRTEWCQSLRPRLTPQKKLHRRQLSVVSWGSDSSKGMTTHPLGSVSNWFWSTNL